MLAKMKKGKADCCPQMSTSHLDETIRKKAQEVYEKSGCKPGRDLHNWLVAERLVKKQNNSDMRRMPR